MFSTAYFANTYSRTLFAVGDGYWANYNTWDSARDAREDIMLMNKLNKHDEMCYRAAATDAYAFKIAAAQHFEYVDGYKPENLSPYENYTIIGSIYDDDDCIDKKLIDVL